MENLWKIEHKYDNGELYEDRWYYTRVEYVQGTDVDVRKYLAQMVDYNPSNLIEFDIVKHNDENCYCPLVICKGEGIRFVKATHSVIPNDFDEPRDKYSFYKEDGDEIIFASIYCTYESEEYRYDTWEEDVYTATPTTLDQIVKVL